jgi:hypothetical protein
MSVFHTTTASKLMASGLEAEHCKYFHSLQLFTKSHFPICFATYCIQPRTATVALEIQFTVSYPKCRSLNLSGLFRNQSNWDFLWKLDNIFTVQKGNTLNRLVLHRYFFRFPFLIYRGFTALPPYIFGKYYLQWGWGYQSKSWPVFSSTLQLRW